MLLPPLLPPDELGLPIGSEGPVLTVLAVGALCLPPSASSPAALCIITGAAWPGFNGMGGSGRIVFLTATSTRDTPLVLGDPIPENPLVLGDPIPAGLLLAVGLVGLS